MNAIRTWYEALGQRERKIFFILGGLLIAAILWSIWDWQASTNERMQSAVPRARTQLARMQGEAAEIARLRSLPQAQAENIARVKEALDASAIGHKLKLDVRVDANQILVTGKNINFEEWIGWLADAQRNHAVRLVWLDVGQAPGGPGAEAHFLVAQ